MRSSRPVLRIGLAHRRVQRVVDGLDARIASPPRRACPRSRAAPAGGAGGRSRSGGPTSAARAPGRAPRRRPRRRSRACAAPRAARPRLALEGQHRVDAAELLADDRRERQPRGVLVVQAHDRGPVAGLQRAPDRADAGAHGGEGDGGEAALGRQRDELERRPRDHAERPLGPDEELRQLRPDGVARARPPSPRGRSPASPRAATAAGPRSCRSGSRARRSRGRRCSRRPSPTRPRPGSAGASGRGR